jgi:outer membrane protein assembly factor BamB
MKLPVVTGGRGRPRRFRVLRPRWVRVVGRLAAASVLVCVWAGLAATPAGAQGTADWPSFLFDKGHSSYNAAATSISTGNVADLQPVWQWFQPNGGYRQFEASPTVVDGVVYIGSEDGYFYAVSEATQQVLWSKFFGTVPDAACGPAGVTATAAVEDDSATGLTVYVNAPNGKLYALSAATGATLWQATVDTPSTTVDNYYAWSSPLVAAGHVYVGISSQCDKPYIPGGVAEYNQNTGAHQATWNALPSGDLGASVWSSLGESTLGDGSVFATTGNAPGATAKEAPHSQSIVRLSGSDLSLLDSWEVPVSERIGDGDFGGSPTMFTADLDGTATPMVGACNKNGSYYAFRQDDLHDGPVWQRQIAAPYGTKPNPGECDAAAIWDGKHLIEGGGNAAIINGVSYQGSVQSLDPATGTAVWETGLPGQVIGSPTEDGSGVVAAQVFESTTGNLGVYLLSAASGAILDYINTNPSPQFAQPVFAGDDLLVAGSNAVGVTAYEITTPGSPVTAVKPGAVGQGGSVTVTLTGSGFSGTPSVFVSGTLVTPSSVVVISPTSLQVTLSANATAAVGPRNITVIEPGPVADTCTNCLTVDPAPTVSSATPSSIPQGEATAITLAGTGFRSGAHITSSAGISFSGTKFVGSAELTTTATVAASVAAGSYNLRVTNPDGGTAVCTGCLTVTADSASTMTAVSLTRLASTAP